MNSNTTEYCYLTFKEGGEDMGRVQDAEKAKLALQACFVPQCIQLQEGDQGQVGGPQVPLPGHGDEIENPNWACRD